MIGEIAARECYTGQATYNKNERVTNPAKPLGDITLGVKRTLLRPKPKEGRVTFNIPALTTRDLWEKANTTLRERGRGRGKQGKSVQALLRARIMCPRCGKPMAVKRKKDGSVFYHCRAHYCTWMDNPCQYRRFIPSTWDDDIWQQVCVLLQDDSWIDEQISTELNKGRDFDKLIQQQKKRIDRCLSKTQKVEEGYDGGFYSLEEAKTKKGQYQIEIDKIQVEIADLKTKKNEQGLSPDNVRSLRQELERLRDRNIREATFEQKSDLLAMLGIVVYPAEDLKSRKINCQLTTVIVKKEGEQTGSAKVVFGRPCRSRTCDTLIKSQAPLCSFNQL